MNAIVGLCHFCEAHGPRPLFCTFTTDNESHITEPSKNTAQCTGCTSLGPETVMVSRDDDGTIYCSRDTVPNPDVSTFLRQAAVRSITCEVNWSKEGGVVYFSETQGHVLSLTFQLQDTRSRGLKRWFSIVVLMKDKMMLLNITSLLSEHMQKVAKELQDLTSIVFDNEQKVCSQRALRLNTGRNDFGQSRSLIQLTGDENVFKKLHSHFTWMLKTGGITYTETLYTSEDLLKKLKPQAVNDFIPESICLISSDEECIPLRALESLLTTPVFRVLLYCTLMGINITIKTLRTDTKIIIIKSIAQILPIDNYDKVPNISTGSDSDQTAASATMCILEETENKNFIFQWPGILPSKCPTIMCRIEKALINTKFNDDVLHQHLKALQIEWLGIAKAVKCAVASSGQKSNAVVKLKQVFSMTDQDNLLVNYWINQFCN